MAHITRLNLLPTDLRTIFRKLERVEVKIINAEWSLFFNKTCIKENFWPNYTTIIIYLRLLSSRGASSKFNWVV